MHYLSRLTICSSSKTKQKYRDHNEPSEKQTKNANSMEIRTNRAKDKLSKNIEITTNQAKNKLRMLTV